MQYIAERVSVPLPVIYDLRPPHTYEQLDDDDETAGQQHKVIDNDGFEDYAWSAWNVCESYAFSKHWLTAKSARPDAHRAARAILTDVVDGKVLFSVEPPHIEMASVGLEDNANALSGGGANVDNNASAPIGNDVDIENVVEDGGAESGSGDGDEDNEDSGNQNVYALLGDEFFDVE